MVDFYQYRLSQFPAESLFSLSTVIRRVIFQTAFSVKGFTNDPCKQFQVNSKKVPWGRVRTMAGCLFGVYNYGVLQMGEPVWGQKNYSYIMKWKRKKLVKIISLWKNCLDEILMKNFILTSILINSWVEKSEKSIRNILLLVLFFDKLNNIGYLFRVFLFLTRAYSF